MFAVWIVVMVSNFTKLYALNICNSLYIKYTLIKLCRKKKEKI